MISVLISPTEADRDLAIALERLGARALTWPELEVSEPESYSSLDEAIENLFGYDWLILKNPSAAHFFLRRLQELNHEVSELDTLRVAAIGEATMDEITASCVHVDVPIPRFHPSSSAIESFVGDRAALAGLNFLIPSGGVTHERLEHQLEDAGARVDAVVTYRTGADNQRLAHMNALLAGGGIDCAAFARPESIEEFAQLCDTDHLSVPLSEVLVACLDEATGERAALFGLSEAITPGSPTVAELAKTIISSTRS